MAITNNVKVQSPTTTAPAAPALELNLQRLGKAEDIVGKAAAAFAGKAVRLATAGYSAPPTPAYEGQTKAFLESLVGKLGGNNVGLVTSPTADKGSVDAVTTTIGQQQKLPLLNVTAESYVGYIDPAKFPAEVDKAAYAKAPKYVFPDAAEYSKATALASNAFIATGGRDATVGDFVNAIKQGNRVVIVDNEQLGGAQWSPEKSRPNNAAKYLSDQIAAALRGEPLPLPELPGKGFDAAFIQAHLGDLQKLVKVVTVKTDADISVAAASAAAHLKGASDVASNADVRGNSQMNRANRDAAAQAGLGFGGVKGGLPLGPWSVGK